MARFLNAVKERGRAAPKSFALLFVVPAFFLFAYFAAFLYFRQSLFTLWPCGFHSLTGLYCPSCGSTRAVEALIRFRFLESLRHNPLPLTVSAFLAAVWVNGCVNVFVRKRDVLLPGFYIWFYSALGAAFLFCVVRNIGLLSA